MRSFTSLATIRLPHPHVLHPDACSPTMDLVALLREVAGDGAGAGAAAGGWSKGKARAGGAGVTTKVALWRMSGSKVWEVDVIGRVLGLAWSLDGRYLSVLLLRLDPYPATDAATSANKSVIEHLNVHTGEVAKVVPVPGTLMASLDASVWLGPERPPRAQWWPMEWVKGGDAWNEPSPGSSLMIIDSLPRVTPVDPPKPAIINPFAMRAPVAKAKPGSHPKLTTFPALLPSTPQVPPDVLVLSPPVRHGKVDGTELRLLTGTFPLARGTPSSLPTTTLGLAQRADRIERLLDVVMRATQAAETAFRESEKQTMIWREELESCGEQQGESVAAVHADLFRFLMTSRCRPGVAEWLGNRMTNRTVSKWETILQTTFATIHKVISQSISPALEHIILILDELRRWSGDLADCDLVMDRDALDRGIAIARGLAVLVETMRQDAETEQAAADEWIKFLRYEMARMTTSVDDHLPIAVFDLKLVWSFIKNGFVDSKFRQAFPNVPEAKDDILPSSAIVERPPAKTNLDSVMRATLSRLTAPPRPELLASPPILADQSYSSHGSPLRGGIEHSPEPMSSPDTMGSPGASHSEPPIERVPALEPWSWVNALVAICKDIITTAHPRAPVASTERTDGVASAVSESFLSERVIDGKHWTVSMSSTEELIIFVAEDAGIQGARLVLDNSEIVQAAFFDDDELALVFQRGSERFLATVLVSALEEVVTTLVPHMIGNGANMLAMLPATSFPIERCRLLGPTRHPPASEPWLLALNGRVGRRSGCVLTRGGAEVEVLDLDGDEDEDEDDDDDEDEEEEDDGGDVEME